MQVRTKRKRVYEKYTKYYVQVTTMRVLVKDTHGIIHVNGGYVVHKKGGTSYLK